MAVFRRTRRLGRKLVAASGPGGSQSVPSVPGVPEDEDFQDPPRHWGRVGALVGVWAVMLAGGAWFAPGFASGGGAGDVDPRDEAATDAPGAALRYLRFSTNGEMDRAEEAICENADPDLTPSDIGAIRDDYADALGGLSGIDVSSEDPVPTADGIVIAGTVFYISQGQRRSEEFTVTVQENGDEYCVSNAVRVNEPDDPDQEGVGADPETLAAEYLRAMFLDRDMEAAEEYQCPGYDGIATSEVEQAIADWDATNATPGSEASGRLNDLQPLGPGTSADSESFEIEVQLRGIREEHFLFEVEVQGDCVASLEGGEGLIPTE